MSKDDLQSFDSRRRILLYIIEKFLGEKGLPEIANSLKTEARLNDYEVCDNVDLDTILLEYVSFCQYKFGKYPKLLRKLNKDEMMKIENKVKQAISNTNNKQLKKKEACKIKETVSTSSLLKETMQIKPVPVNHNEILQVPMCEFSLESFDFSPDLKELAMCISKNLVKTDFGLRWNNIVGNTDAINILKEAVILPVKRPDLFTKSTKPWKSVLLHGPPGNGKTMIAKTLCSESLNILSFFNITSSTLTSKWRGESEKLIKILFKIAKHHAPSVIFIDEIECLTSKRDDNFENDASMRFKNEFLSLMDGFLEDDDGVFILANSNLPWIIDDAFLRRFEKKILIDLPNSTERIGLIKKFIPESEKWPNKSFENLLEKCEGFTGDEIRIACKEAKMNQIRNNIDGKGGKYVDELDLVEAFLQIQPSTEKSIIKHKEWNKRHGHQFIKKEKKST